MTTRTTALTVAALTLALALTGCAANGSTAAPTAPDPAPVQTTAPTTPHEPVEVDLRGEVVQWTDIVAVFERGDIPVLWLRNVPGATLTIEGSNVIDSFSVSGMERVRNSSDDLVLSPKISVWDGSVTSSGGEVSVTNGGVYFQVKADRS